MAKNGNGKVTYCVFDSLHGYPVMDESNRTRLDPKAVLYFVLDWIKVVFAPVTIVKLGGVTGNWDDNKPFIKRWNNYNSHLGVKPEMYKVRFYNIDTGLEMNETELHRFIKANPDRTGLRFCKKDVQNKNEWYIVVDPEQFALWMNAATRKGGVLPRVPNVLTKAQDKILDESYVKIRKYDNLFWYLATRFRKSGTCLELNRREVHANFMLISSPISESLDSYKGVINSFQGFEDYILIDSTAYGSDIDALKADISKYLLAKKTVAFFATWAWFKNDKDSKDKWNFLDGVEGLKKTFLVIDEFHNAADTDSSTDIVENLQKFAPAKTLYMSGTPFNELINNSGFNKKGIFNSDALIIYDLGDLLKSDEYKNFRLEHRLMCRIPLGETKAEYNCDFEFHKDGMKNSFKEFAEKTKAYEAFALRKTNICYMKDCRNMKVAFASTKEKYKGNSDYKIFMADNLADTKGIIDEIKKFHKTHENGHCVVFVCNKLVMGATIKSCDGVHFMRKIGSAEFAVQAWGRTLTLKDGKESAAIHYYDDNSFWNIYLQFDISHDNLTRPRRNEYYKNGEIVFKHIFNGLSDMELPEKLVIKYLNQYRELASKESSVALDIATGFDFDSDIDLDDSSSSKKSGKNGKDKEMLPGNNDATSTIGTESTPTGNGGGTSNESKKPASKKEKIIQYIKDNLINYMYFATSLFSVEELNKFESIKPEDSKFRHESSLGVFYENPIYDQYFAKIRMMNTHIIGAANYWTKMCDNHRVSVLTEFRAVLNYTKPENYGDTFDTISHKVVTELYEKNKSLVADKQ